MIRDFSGEIGKKYWRLTILRELPRRKTKRHFECICECGEVKSVEIYRILGGKAKSCGCLTKEVVSRLRTTHGGSKTKMYRIWFKMKQRCENKNNGFYRYYGGKGIKVCDRWQNFENFLADMGQAPKGKTLDRIDNDMGYSPDNCRWADRITQANNKSNNHIIELDGVKKNITQWGKFYGINPHTIRSRIDTGWDVRYAVITPLVRQIKKKAGLRGAF